MRKNDKDMEKTGLILKNKVNAYFGKDAIGRYKAPTYNDSVANVNMERLKFIKFVGDAYEYGILNDRDFGYLLNYINFKASLLVSDIGVVKVKGEQDE